ncbi:MAG TPA: hypothetical protein VND19_25435 [Acetobacteraceae bacterium]|nr:hypothetical protein [Acetobacteraceae bacterium]
MAPLLAGCSSVPSSVNPVSWWHDLEGGAIARQRPPPPGANQPYPNLATVPARPQAPDSKALAAITQGLVADRAHADYLAAATPLPDPSSPTASPALFGQGTLPPPPPASAAGPTPLASASLPAASAPPVPSGPPPAPSPAPVRPVRTTPLAPPAAVAPPVRASSTVPSGAGAPSSPVSPGNAAPHVAQNAPLAPPGAAVIPPPVAAPGPPIPTAPPAPPSLSGPGAPAIAPTVVASAAAPTAPAPRANNATTVEFVLGSAILPPGAADVLKGVVAKRGQAVIAVTGYGEAKSDDPDAQSAALSLGLSRAQAVANVLTGDGVPAAAVRVGAEAGGRGASLRLIQ